MEEKKLTKNDLVHAIVAISDSIMELSLIHISEPTRPY